jgi:hypothetical protein
MMLPPVWPWEAGGVIPVGTAPETTAHLTGAPNGSTALVLQPVVANQTTPIWLTARVEGPVGDVITHVPPGAAGGVTGLIVGVQPLRLTVSLADLLSWSDPAVRCGEAVARILNLPSSPAERRQPMS